MNLKIFLTFFLISCLYFSQQKSLSQNFFSQKPFSEDKIDSENSHEDKVISIFSLNFIYDGQMLDRNSKISCDLEFQDDSNNEVIKKIDKFSNFIALESSRGKVFLKSIKCSRHSIPLIFGTSRYKTIGDYGFVAHEDFINYIGEINIDYRPSFFMPLDLFNLSALTIDKSGVIAIKIEDKITEALDFINTRFNDVYHLKLTKSLMNDNHFLKPNDPAKIYSPSDLDEDIKKNANKAYPPLLQPYGFGANNNIANQAPNLQNNPQNAPAITSYNQQTSGNEGPKYQLDTPQHPYLAPKFSEFYAPLYNPYYTVGAPFIVNNAMPSDTQDPAIEHR